MRPNAVSGALHDHDGSSCCLFGERERANLVVTTGDFSIYTYVTRPAGAYSYIWHCTYNNVLRGSKDTTDIDFSHNQNNLVRQIFHTTGII